MANLPLAFAELLAGGVLITAGIADANGSIKNVIAGVDHGPAALPGSSSTTGGSAGSSGGSIGGPTPTAAGGSYTNPLPGASFSRVDQGVDFTAKGNVVALGNSKVVASDASNSGWKGGGYMALQLLDGPLAGSVYYVAEGIKPLLRVGQTVAAGKPIAALMNNPYNGVFGNGEIGWANPNSPEIPLAKSTGGYTEGDSTGAGVSFNNLLKSVGAAGGHVLATILGDASHLGAVL